MKGIKFFSLLILLSSCQVGKKDSEEMISTIESIEEYLSIEDRSQETLSERLGRIKIRLADQRFLEKFPVRLLNENSVSLDSSFTAGWTMASYMPSSLPVAVLSSNDGIDTVFFNTDCACFPIEIKHVVEGENRYKGKVFDNGRVFVFEGWFNGVKP